MSACRHFSYMSSNAENEFSVLLNMLPPIHGPGVGLQGSSINYFKWKLCLYKCSFFFIPELFEASFDHQR